MRKVDRILATSDLHGQSKRFQRLLQAMEYAPEQDLLIICGDVIDRGQDNIACLERCRELQAQGAIVLKGNHEQFLENCLQEMLTSENWRTRPSTYLYNWVAYNGGAAMYREIENLPRETLASMLTFVRRLPVYYLVGRYVFSHAGANPAKPVEENSEDELVWMSERFPAEPGYAGKIMVFGHTPTWLLPGNATAKSKKNAGIWYDRKHKDKLCVDCGGVFGGRLAAIELPACREFYA